VEHRGRGGDRAAVAASFSYMHALDVITAHSRPSRLNVVAPLCIDEVDSSSMVLLNDARRGLDAHWLAYLGLGLGISATLAINVLSGCRTGSSVRSCPPGQPSRWCSATNC